MNYTFPINKTELLLFSGFSLLWQCLELEDSSNIVKDNQRLLLSLTQTLVKDDQTAGDEFLRIAGHIVPMGNQRLSTPLASSHSSSPAARSNRSPGSMAAPSPPKQKSTKKVLQGLVSSIPSFGSTKNKLEEVWPRRATLPPQRSAASIGSHPRSYSSVSLASARPSSAVSRNSTSGRIHQGRNIDFRSHVNLDYFPIGEEEINSSYSLSNTIMQPTQRYPTTTKNSQQLLNNASWEQLVTSMDTGAAAIFAGLYGNTELPSNPSFHSLHDPNSYGPNSTEWPYSPDHQQQVPPLDDSWASLSAVDLTNIHPIISKSSSANVPQSVLSFSDESLASAASASADDLIFSASGSNNGSTLSSVTTIDTDYRGMKDDTGASGVELGDVDELSRCVTAASHHSEHDYDEREEEENCGGGKSTGSGFRGIVMPTGVVGVDVDGDEYGFVDDGDDDDEDEDHEER